MSCKACGYKGHISAMSKSEGKMESYIIKNPIDDSASSVSGKKSGKKGRKAHEKKQRKSPDNERTPELKPPAPTANNDDNFSEEWTDNVTTISEKLKNSAVSNVTSLIQDDNISQQTLQQRTNTFLELAKDVYDQKGISGLRGSVAILKNESAKLDLENRAAPILAEILLTNSILEDIPKSASVLIHVS